MRAICGNLFGDKDAYRPLLPSLVGGFDKVFYYDAVSGREHGEGQEAYATRVEPEHERFAQFQALDRVHVALGKIVGKDRRQKGVDVRLAVDMMTHAFRGKIGRATLFAGDADFVPLVQALVNEGLHITLWHPPQASTDLKGAADSNRAFSFQTDAHCFTFDDLTPAFQMTSSGSGQVDLAAHGVLEIVKISGQQFAGSWDGETLTVFRIDAVRGSANFVSFRAPKAPLARALVAFQAIYGWEVAETGEQWITTR